MSKNLTATDLKGFAHVLVESAFDLLTEDAALAPEWCGSPGVRAAVLADYDFALRRMGVLDSATRQECLRALDAQLQGGQPVRLTFRLSPNTFATILHEYAVDLADRWPSRAA